MRERDNNFYMDFEDNGFGGSAMEQNEALANMIQPPAPAKTDYTQALKQQILAQGRSDKWTGQGRGSAEANAEDMAKILAGIGITDINQFGKITKTVPGYSYETEQGTVDVPEQVVQTYGNKATGQEVPNTYSERQSGNFFGGTFEGKGNTGYGVQFDQQGNPIFYTQGASSNDLVNLFKDDPLLGAIAQVGAAYFGGPAGSAALAAAMGKDPVDILKSTALSYLGNAAGSAVSGMEGITDVLGKTGTEIASNAAKQFVGSGGNIDPVQALLSSGLNAGINTVATDLGMSDLTPAQQKMVSSGISGLIAGQTPEQIAMNVAMAAATAKPDSTLKSSLGPGNEQDFIDNLIPGYFQPGGAGYAEPAALPSPEEDFVPTMPAPEEITVQPEPANIEEFIKSLEPYVAPAPTPEPPPEPAPVVDNIVKQLLNSEPTPEPYQPVVDLPDYVQEPVREPEPEPTPAPAPTPEPTPEPTPAPEEMTVQQKPANIEEFIRSLEQYVAPAPTPEPVQPEQFDQDNQDAIDRYIRELIPEPSDDELGYLTGNKPEPMPEPEPELVQPEQFDQDNQDAIDKIEQEVADEQYDQDNQDAIDRYIRELTSEEIPELVMTGNRDKTQEHVFDPTFGGALPLDNLPYLPTDDDFVPTNEIEVPETPTTPVKTPKVPTPTKAPTTRAPTAPAASSGMDLMGLLALLGGQQQPMQQAPMQDPYAHIKLMEDLFGSEIDLTPAGEATAKRK